jgi:hypothetical protein
MIKDTKSHCIDSIGEKPETERGQKDMREEAGIVNLQDSKLSFFSWNGLDVVASSFVTIKAGKPIGPQLSMYQ